MMTILIMNREEPEKMVGDMSDLRFQAVGSSLNVALCGMCGGEWL